MKMLNRLAQIAQELEEEGLPDEALMLDNATEPLQNHNQSGPSVLDTIAHFVQSVMQQLPASPEAIVDPNNQAYVNQAIDNSVR